jgi:hypothetical protein
MIMLKFASHSPFGREEKKARREGGRNRGYKKKGGKADI